MLPIYVCGFYGNLLRVEHVTFFGLQIHKLFILIMRKHETVRHNTIIISQYLELMNKGGWREIGVKKNINDRKVVCKLNAPCFSRLHTLFPAGELQISQMTFVKREFFGGSSCQNYSLPISSEQNQGHSIFSIKPRMAQSAAQLGRASTLLPHRSFVSNE